MTRWATFDCYGTLIDWNGGIRAVLARVFGAARAGEQLRRYHELEPDLEADGTGLVFGATGGTVVRGSLAGLLGWATGRGGDAVLGSGEPAPAAPRWI